MQDKYDVINFFAFREATTISRKTGGSSLDWPNSEYVGARLLKQTWMSENWNSEARIRRARNSGKTQPGQHLLPDQGRAGAGHPTENRTCQHLRFSSHRFGRL
jgi:hypothetical protein